jgi:hypothetical protein
VPVVVVEVVVEDSEPRTVNDSEGIVPELFDASDGQPGEVQPMPEFSSQYTGSPLGTLPFSRFSQ